MAGSGFHPIRLPGPTQTGKLYELYVLALELASKRANGWRFSFVPGTQGVFRGAPGAVDTAFHHFRFEAPTNVGSTLAGHLWTDIEYVQYDTATRGATFLRGVPRSLRHELDILYVAGSGVGFPCPPVIVEGVECKHTRLTKGMLREMIAHRMNATTEGRTRVEMAYGRSLVGSVTPTLKLSTIDGGAHFRYRELCRHWAITMEYRAPQIGRASCRERV